MAAILTRRHFVSSSFADC